MSKTVYYLQVWFSGRVQGVGFRYMTMGVARGFEVCGTVQNLDDGRVRMEAEGVEEEVLAFLDEIRVEMEGYIKDVQTLSEYRGERSFEGFRIL